MTDSAAFTGIYGLSSKKSENKIQFNTLDKYSSFVLNVTGAQRFTADSARLVVQLVDKSDNVVRQQVVTDGHADFYFVKPATYYVRAFHDLNANGIWDTGLYDERRQAEPVYYYSKPIEMRENWDYSEDWDPLVISIDKQKPADLRKTKSEKKEKKSKNQQREEQKRKQKKRK